MTRPRVLVVESALPTKRGPHPERAADLEKLAQEEETRAQARGSREGRGRVTGTHADAEEDSDGTTSADAPAPVKRRQTLAQPLARRLRQLIAEVGSIPPDSSLLEELSVAAGSHQSYKRELEAWLEHCSEFGLELTATSTQRSSNG